MPTRSIRPPLHMPDDPEPTHDTDKQYLPSGGSTRGLEHG